VGTAEAADLTRGGQSEQAAAAVEGGVGEVAGAGPGGGVGREIVAAHRGVGVPRHDIAGGADERVDRGHLLTVAVARDLGLLADGAGGRIDLRQVDDRRLRLEIVGRDPDLEDAGDVGVLDGARTGEPLGGHLLAGQQFLGVEFELAVLGVEQRDRSAVPPVVVVVLSEHLGDEEMTERAPLVLLEPEDGGSSRFRRAGRGGGRGARLGGRRLLRSFRRAAPRQRQRQRGGRGGGEKTDTTNWLIIAVLVTGLVGVARLKLKAHTILEVVSGFAIGLGCQLCSIFIYNIG